MIKGLFNSQARRACEATDFESEKLTVLQSTFLEARHMTIRVIKIVDYISGHKQWSQAI